jgi:hypothetical protein
MTRAFRISPGPAVVVVLAILALVNVVDVRVAHAELALGPACAVALLGIARLAGLSWAELGLGPGTWRRGLTWAAVIIGMGALALSAGALLPPGGRSATRAITWPGDRRCCTPWCSSPSARCWSRR